MAAGVEWCGCRLRCQCKQGISKRTIRGDETVARFFWVWMVALCAMLALAAPALAFVVQAEAAESETSETAASEYGPKRFMCPVGGEQFEQNVGWIGYPLAARPDGGVLGSELTDMMIPECPGNGLVMVPKHDGEADDEDAFAPYSSEELAMLPALAASPEYQELRKEARYYRLYWIGKKLGRPPAQQLHLLQHISYIAGPPEQQRRYLQFFVDETDAILAGGQPDKPDKPDKTDKPDKIVQLRFHYYVANALRQLGRFDEARTRIAKIDADVRTLRAGRTAQPPANPHFEDDYGDGGEPPEEGIASVAQELLKAIDASDTDKHPVSMMSDKVANSICNSVDDDYPPATELTKSNCAKRAAEKKSYYETLEKNSNAEQALLDDPVKLATMCKATPAEKREEILDSACWRSEREAMREQIESGAAKLLKTPKALDVQCKTVIIPSRYASPKTALGEACQKRREVTREAEATALAAKFRKQPAEFERQCTEEYPDASSENPVEMACYRVQHEGDAARDAILEARLSKMTEAQIWAECEKTHGGDDVPGFTMGFRCRDMERKREDARWKALEADPEKLAATCAIPYDKQEEWYRSRCFDRQEQIEDGQAMAMAKDHAVLMARCDATPVPERDQILHKACSGYRKCLVMRADELPFSVANIVSMSGTIDPAEMHSACFETAEKANAAFARYQTDPKALRASCKPETEFAEEPYDAEMCARYAKGEDVFADAGSDLIEDAVEPQSANDACLAKARNDGKLGSAAAAAGAAAACAGFMASEKK
jgi:hypothetical protein